MRGYKKRNRQDDFGSTGRVGTPFEQQEELVLRLDSGELFDPHVLLPHAELSGIVYNSVNRFVGRYRGKKLTLSIFTDTDNEAVQNTFREVYWTHYEDEYQRINRNLKRRYIRLLLLITVSLGAFCLWETGYTQFARQDALAERQRIARARDAEIAFHTTRSRDTDRS